MLTSLFSFLGGSVFRMLWGEISAMLTARQEHKHELDSIRLQAEIDAAAHTRNMAAIQQQHDLGVEVIRVQADADLSRIDATIFGEGVKLTGKSSGNWFIDAWNGSIRPGLATTSILLIVCDAFTFITMSENAWALSGAALGIYVADRTLFKRSK